MIKKTFLILAVLTFGLLGLKGVSATYLAMDISGGEEEISILTGQIKTLEVESPTRVVISNPDIADINKVTNREITLLGKTQGSTHLFIWDRFGERAVKIWVVREDVADIQRRINRLLNESNLEDILAQVNEQEGKVVVSGTVNEPSQKEQLDLVLAPFKDRIINLVRLKEDQPSVLIDVQILELSVSDLSELGLKWFQSINVREEPYRSTSGETTLNVIGTGHQVFRIVQLSRDALNVKLNFLITEGKGRVLSRPKLVCLSGKTASFLVGGEVPVLKEKTTGSSGTTAAIEYKEYGIRLKIKPTVKENDEIHTTLSTEVSEIDWANAVTIDSSKLPAFTKRTAESELYLREGQTIFLAGLIKNKDTTTLDRFPVLSKVPILSELFKSKKFELGQTELVIALTPTIMRPADGRAQKEEETFDKDLGELSNLPPSTLRYARIVQQKVYGDLIYPAQARKQNLEGKVLLNLHILSDGTLLQAIIEESSGNDILDQAALKSVRKTSPYPPFPPALGLKELWVEVPVIYKSD